MVPPVLIDAVAITDQDALPILDQGQKGFRGAVGTHHRQRHRVGGHSPQPLQGVVAIPGHCINVAHSGLPRQGGKGLVMGDEGVRGPLNHFLDGAQAHGQMQDRVTAIVHETPRIAVHATECSYERRQTRAVAGGVWAGHIRLVPNSLCSGRRQGLRHAFRDHLHDIYPRCLGVEHTLQRFARQRLRGHRVRREHGLRG